MTHRRAVDTALGRVPCSIDIAPYAEIDLIVVVVCRRSLSFPTGTAALPCSLSS